MMGKSHHVLIGLFLLLATCWGCSSSRIRNIDFQRPDRSPQLDAYDVFVGDWNWEAREVDADGPGKAWTGTAGWAWSLDKRFLRGVMSARSSDSAFDVVGYWSWHPTRKEYTWWMFNNWGYPQEGIARYDDAKRRWVMKYTSVGLDGATSYGEYVMSVVGANELKWHMTEWADALRLIKKVEMDGRYTRK